MRVPELLAPAGGPEAFLAALAAGADAVYLGLERFSARAAARGFSLRELAAACRMAHARDVRVYVAMNVLMRDDELNEALAAARAAAAAGADALIVADLGFIARLRAELPDMELHLSTQVGALSAAAGLFAARELGVSRVTCGRELSVGEIEAMARVGVPGDRPLDEGGAHQEAAARDDAASSAADPAAVPAGADPAALPAGAVPVVPFEVEAFVHGAICICYAGACSFSALRRGRSANRGDCTQPCRADYALVDGKGRCLAGNRSFVEAGALAAGAAASGRSAGSASVAGPIAVNDPALGAEVPAPLAPGRPMRASVTARRRASDIVGVGEKLLCPRDYLGIRHVTELTRAGVSALKVEGRMKNPDYIYNVVGCYREALDAEAAGRSLGADALDALEARLARSFNRGFTDGYLTGFRDATTFMSWERSCNQGIAVGRVVARRRDEIDIAFDRAVRAGDTVEVRSVPGGNAPADAPRRWPMLPVPDCVPAGGILAVHCKRKVEVGASVHLVRDEGLVSRAADAVGALRGEWDALLAEPSGGCSRPERLAPPCEAVPAAASALAVPSGLSTAPVLVRSAASKPAAAPESAYVEAWRLLEDIDAWDPLLPDLVVILDEVHRDADALWVEHLCRRSRAVVCRNLGQIPLARSHAARFEVAAPLNVWNAGAARVLAGLGASRIWLPDELDASAAAAIRRALAGVVPVGAGLPHPAVLMTIDRCVLAVEGPCNGVCRSCSRRTAARFLVDRDGARYPVRVDARGRTRIIDTGA